MSHDLNQRSSRSAKDLDEHIISLSEHLYPDGQFSGPVESLEVRLALIRQASREQLIRFLGRVLAADLSLRQERSRHHVTQED